MGMGLWKYVTDPSLFITITSLETSLLPPMRSCNDNDDDKNNFITSATCTANSRVGKITTAPVCGGWDSGWSQLKEALTSPIFHFSILLKFTINYEILYHYLRFSISIIGITKASVFPDPVTCNILTNLVNIPFLNLQLEQQHLCCS